MMDYQLAYKLQLEKLIMIAQKPEWKAWAWHHAKELAADKSEVFKGIDTDLAKAMQELKK